ncbi:MAG: OmpA family protein [Myxococcales bacterium]|nr:OmpA family protein [Myxococcota bacterium]MDW8280775.1 OmpA family protein [Myxococcales bacterium]
MRPLVLTVLWLLLSAQPGCKPEYPKCDKDAHCPGNKENKEFCVDGTCQQCRPGRSDCPEGRQCKSGRCEAIPGWCQKNEDCATRLCVNNRCTGCQTDAQCAGGRCDRGSCVAESRTRCSSNDDCAESEDCVGGFCVPAGPRANRYAAKAPCELETVYFDFNEAVLSAEATALVDKNVECVKRAPQRGVVLIGHTDPRGTEEYNLALSERRAQAVKERMVRLGTPAHQLTTLPRGEIDATGTDETGWARDRRVESQWR